MESLDRRMVYGEVLAEIDALERIIPQMREAGTRAADWLCSNVTPRGDIARRRRVSFCHKVCWGLYEAGRLEELFRILEWLAKNARRAPAEYYFEDETPFDRDMQRIYRFLTFAKVAEWLRFAPIANDEEREGALRYQHESGGVFANVDKGRGAELEPLNTSFFGHWALAAGLIDRAEAAGDWLVELVELNGKHLAGDPPTFYYRRSARTGKVVTRVPRGQDVNFRIGTVRIKQSSWVIGTTVSLLAVLYRRTAKQKYLRAALKLAEYESKAGHAQLFWPSKCKVAWGIAELYAIMGDPIHRELAANVDRVTFMQAQLPCGGWSHMFYPLRESGAWRRVVYQGAQRDVPETLPRDGSFGLLSAYEITGEFLAEMATSRKRFEEVLARLRLRKADLETELKLKG